MSWSTPPTQATGDLITAAIYNTYLINNLLTLPQLDYAQITSPVSTTATTEGTSTALITGNSITYSGVKVLVEFWAPGVIESGGAQTTTLVLYRDTTVLGQVPIDTSAAVSVTVPFEPVYAAVYDTPAAGAHTYAVKGFVSTNTGTVVAGAGGSGNKPAAFLRVSGAGV